MTLAIAYNVIGLLRFSNSFWVKLLVYTWQENNHFFFKIFNNITILLKFNKLF